MKKYRNINKITRPIVVALISKIVIINSNQIEIHFLFEDEMAELIKYVETGKKEDEET